MVAVREPSGALRSEFAPTVTSTLEEDTVLLEPWLLTENDLQWLISLGKKRYGEDYDYLTVEGWFRNIVLKNPTMFHAVRLQNSFLIGMLSCVPWLPSEFEYHTIFICTDFGHGWEAMKLLRSSIAWAKMRKLKRWRMSSDTDVDLAMMARRLGATEISPRFTLNL